MCTVAQSTTATQFYAKLFVENHNWNAPFPNYDEATRAAAVLPMLAQVAERHYAQHDRRLELIDVGCGRGWLTNLVSAYGNVLGLDPVASVIDHARRLFPWLRFCCGDPASYLAQNPGAAFDVVLCSEVIEHVPDEAKPAFMRSLRDLTRSRGALIMTTPRGELFEQWKQLQTQMQPVEQWLTEAALDTLVRQCNYRVVLRDRCRLREFPVRLPTRNPQRLLVRALRRIKCPGFRPWREPVYQVLLLEPIDQH